MQDVLTQRSLSTAYRIILSSILCYLYCVMCTGSSSIHAYIGAPSDTNMCDVSIVLVVYIVCPALHAKPPQDIDAGSGSYFCDSGVEVSAT